MNISHVRALTAAMGMGAVAMATACGSQAGTDQSSARQSPTSSSSSSPVAAAKKCTKDDLKMTIRGGPNGTAAVVFPLVFTNTSDRPCLLRGVPEVSITGGDGSPAGIPATENDIGGVSTVTLAPGEAASAPLGQKPPKSVPGCDNFEASGYAVTLPRARKWTTIWKDSTACTGKEEFLVVGPIKKGANNTKLPGFPD